jgi:hypothetical protein
MMSDARDVAKSAMTAVVKLLPAQPERRIEEEIYALFAD